MTWSEHNREIRVIVVDDYEEGQSRVFQDDPYTVSITVNNITMNGIAGDITTTLEVMVDDIDNGTDITCATVQNTDHRVIYIASELNLMKIN